MLTGTLKMALILVIMSLTVSLFLTVYTVKCPVKGTFSLSVRHHLIDDESGDGQVKH